MDPATYDAVVVGAGLSGLVTAHELTKAGLDIVVLEAGDRPGGRTRSVAVGGVVLDLGGEWVDEAHTEIRNLAADLGVGLTPAKHKKAGGARWYVNGHLSSEMPLSDRDAKIYRRMNEALVGVAEAANSVTPWEDAPSEEEDISVEGWLQREKMSNAGLHIVRTLISGCGSTVPLEQMSFYSYAVKVATRGGPGRGNEYRIEGGAGRLVETLRAELGERIRYGSPVTALLQDGQNVRVRWTGGEARARHTVLAIPINSHKKVRFEPQPPPIFRRMISRAVYGAARKMSFVYDSSVEPGAPFLTDTPLGYCYAAQASGETRAIVSFLRRPATISRARPTSRGAETEGNTTHTKSIRCRGAGDRDGKGLVLGALHAGKLHDRRTR